MRERGPGRAVTATAPALKGSSWREADSCSVLCGEQLSGCGRRPGPGSGGRRGGSENSPALGSQGVRAAGRGDPGCPRHLLHVQPAGPQRGRGSPGFADSTSPRHRPRPRVRWVAGGSACREAAGSGRALDRGTGSGDGSGPAQGADRRPRPGHPLVRSQAGPDGVTPAAQGVADLNTPSPERRVPSVTEPLGSHPQSGGRGRPLGCPSHDGTQDWGRK